MPDAGWRAQLLHQLARSEFRHALFVRGDASHGGVLYAVLIDNDSAPEATEWRRFVGNLLDLGSPWLRARDVPVFPLNFQFGYAADFDTVGQHLAMQRALVARAKENGPIPPLRHLKTGIFGVVEGYVRARAPRGTHGLCDHSCVRSWPRVRECVRVCPCARMCAL